MNLLGYVRVSDASQNEDRQMVSMAEQGVPAKNIYVDKQSGKDFERKSYRSMLRRLRPGDCIMLHSLDRLGRDYAAILEQWHEGQGRGHRCAGYAPARHPRERPRLDRTAYIGHHLAVTQLLLTERTREHTPTTGRGNRCSKGTGRGVWAADEGRAGQLRRTHPSVGAQAVIFRRSAGAVRGNEPSNLL